MSSSEDEYITFEVETTATVKYMGTGKIKIKDLENISKYGFVDSNNPQDFYEENLYIAVSNLGYVDMDIVEIYEEQFGGLDNLALSDGTLLTWERFMKIYLTAIGCNQKPLFDTEDTDG